MTVSPFLSVKQMFTLFVILYRRLLYTQTRINESRMDVTDINFNLFRYKYFYQWRNIKRKKTIIIKHNAYTALQVSTSPKCTYARTHTHTHAHTQTWTHIETSTQTQHTHTHTQTHITETIHTVWTERIYVSYFLPYFHWLFTMIMPKRLIITLRIWKRHVHDV